MLLLILILRSKKVGRDVRIACSSVMAQILGEPSHLLTIVTNRFSYLQVEKMMHLGPLLF